MRLHDFILPELSFFFCFVHLIFFYIYLNWKPPQQLPDKKSTANSLLAVSFSTIHYESKSNANARVHNPLSIW